MKIPQNIFIDIDEMILKCICNRKEVRVNITILKKGMKLVDFSYSM